ncbi:MAG: hypothetical protein ACI93R_000303 [Flavobacteriales bacterium]|jgi:uncharacterized protein YajQ (UPF0234 family)
MPTFDIVSEIDTHEVQNAIDNANRELSTRFDFRGVEASFDHDNDITTIKTESDFQVDQMRDILRNKIVSRGISADSMSSESIEHSGKSFVQKINYKAGIEGDIAKKLVKLVKDSKVKVQCAIQGEKLRITGKKRDDLQAVMALVRGAELGQPFQFNNFRD